VAGTVDAHHRLLAKWYVIAQDVSQEIASIANRAEGENAATTGYFSGASAQAFRNVTSQNIQPALVKIGKELGITAEHMDVTKKALQAVDTDSAHGYQVKGSDGHGHSFIASALRGPSH
jgi:hypothetical protein